MKKEIGWKLQTERTIFTENFFEQSRWGFLKDEIRFESRLMIDYDFNRGIEQCSRYTIISITKKHIVVRVQYIRVLELPVY